MNSFPGLPQKPQPLAPGNRPDRSDTPSDQNIDTLSHRKALARQQQTTRPEQLHYTIQGSHEYLSHW